MSLSTPFLNRHSGLFYSADKISEEPNDNYLFSPRPFENSDSEIIEINNSDVYRDEKLELESEDYLRKLTSNFISDNREVKQIVKYIKN